MAKVRSMTNEQLAAMHGLLAEYHRKLAKEAALDVVQQYHADLGQRLADEAVLIPRRTAIVGRSTSANSKSRKMAARTKHHVRNPPDRRDRAEDEMEVIAFVRRAVWR